MFLYICTQPENQPKVVAGKFERKTAHNFVTRLGNLTSCESVACFTGRDRRALEQFFVDLFVQQMNMRRVVTYLLCTNT